MDRKIGTVAYGATIGYKSNARFVWLACPDCGKRRWVNYYSLKRPNYHGRCKSCDAKAYPLHPSYQGRFLTSEGYVMVQLAPSDFFFPMAEKNGYIKEHRLIMAKSLRRCLMPIEVVHHKNGLCNDNRLVNLKLTTPSTHVAHHNSIGAYRGTQTMKATRHLY